VSSDIDMKIHRADILFAVNKLIRKRIIMAFGLSALLLVIYTAYCYMLGAPTDVSNTKVSGTINLVVFLSLFTVVAGICIAGLYTWWANTILDPQLDDLREKYDTE
jgi:uncharacterized membrane protein (DUF485 family)